MEVKINKEIRNYTESIFFGLSLRQFICTVLGCAIAVLLYFLFKPLFGLEFTSWACMLGALTFILLGFVKYNEMPLKKLFIAFIKSEILTPRELHFKAVNINEEIVKKYLDNKKKEELKYDKINFFNKKARKRNAYSTAITQNVEYLLASNEAGSRTVTSVISEINQEVYNTAEHQRFFYDVDDVEINISSNN